MEYRGKAAFRILTGRRFPDPQEKTQTGLVPGPTYYLTCQDPSVEVQAERPEDDSDESQTDFGKRIGQGPEIGNEDVLRSGKPRGAG